jgi:hypothetical protein
MGNSEEEKPIRRPRRLWENNIRIDLKGNTRKIGWYGLDRSDSGFAPVEGFCEHGNEPSGSIQCLEILGYLKNWKKNSAPWSQLVNNYKINVL